MREVLLTGAVRTPIGDLNGSLSSLSAVELGKISAKASIENTGTTPAEIEEVIVGNVLQAGQGQNPARQIAVGCDVPYHVPSFTVNQVCGSGLKAIDLAYQRVASGEIKTALAGGIESMSRAPHILQSLRGGVKLGETPLPLARPPRRLAGTRSPRFDFNRAAVSDVCPIGERQVPVQAGACPFFVWTGAVALGRLGRERSSPPGADTSR